MPKSCQDLSADLVALAWERLEGEPLASLERHVDSCGECRAELAKLRSVRSLVSSVTGIEPSKAFHSRVMARAARLDRTGLDSTGPASRKLAALAERDRPRVFTPRQRMIAYLCSISTAAAILVAFQAWKIAVPERVEPEAIVVDDRPEGRIVVARWQERRECADRSEKDVRGTSVDVAGVLPDGNVVLTGVVDLERHERCLMAFRASEWNRYVRLHGNTVAARERARFERISSGRRLATVQGGRLEIPKAMYDRYVGRPDEAVLLRLEGRAEIWSREAYETYTRRLPDIIVDPTDLGALDLPAPGRARSRTFGRDRSPARGQAWTPARKREDRFPQRSRSRVPA